MQSLNLGEFKPSGKIRPDGKTRYKMAVSAVKLREVVQATKVYEKNPPKLKIRIKTLIIQLVTRGLLLITNENFFEEKSNCYK